MAKVKTILEISHVEITCGEKTIKVVGVMSAEWDLFNKAGSKVKMSLCHTPETFGNINMLLNFVNDTVRVSIVRNKTKELDADCRIIRIADSMDINSYPVRFDVDFEILG